MKFAATSMKPAATSMKPAMPTSRASWTRVRLSPDHPFQVFRVPASYFVERIRRAEWFSYSKINHGFWEYERIVRRLPGPLDEEARRRVDAAHGRRFCLETGFREELIALLSSLPLEDPDRFFATSHLAYPGSDRIEGVTADPAGLISVMAATLPPGFVPLDGMLWKSATLSGEIRALFDAIRPHPVTVVGPAWLASLGAHLGLPRFDLIEIHPREARRERLALLDRIRRHRDGLGATPGVYLFQAATLAPWLVGRLHGQLGDACLIDLGRSLDLCEPDRVFRQSWGRVYRRQLSENLGLRDPRIRDSRPFFSTRPLEPWEARAESGSERTRQPRPAALATRRTDRAPRECGFGARRLEDAIAAYWEVPAEARAILCRDRSVALGALAAVSGARRWLVPALADPRWRAAGIAAVGGVDCDARGELDLAALDAVDTGRFDGLLHANPFGLTTSLGAVERWAGRHDMASICDGGGALDAPYRSRSTAAEVVELGPAGPGRPEGLAAAIVPAELEGPLRAFLCAMDGDAPVEACEWTAGRLRDFQDTSVRHHLQYARVVRFARTLGYEPLGPEKTLEKLATPASVPLLAPRPVSAARLARHPVLPVRRPFVALDGFPVAAALASRLVLVPCHPGLEKLDNDALVRALEWIVGGRAGSSRTHRTPPITRP